MHDGVIPTLLHCAQDDLHVEFTPAFFRYSKRRIGKHFERSRSASELDDRHSKDQTHPVLRDLQTIHEDCR